MPTMQSPQENSPTSKDSSSRMNPKSQIQTRKWPIALGVCVASGSLLLTGFVVALFLAENRVYFHLTSGRIRQSTVVAGIVVRERVKDTRASAILKKRGNKIGQDDDWVVVSSTSFWQPNSPHYRFHGAASQVDFLCKVLDECKVSKAEYRRVVVKVMKLLKERKVSDAYNAVDAEARRCLNVK